MLSQRLGMDRGKGELVQKLKKKTLGKKNKSINLAFI